MRGFRSCMDPHIATLMRAPCWKSGDWLWVVEVIAPFGGANEMVKDLKANVFT